MKNLMFVAALIATVGMSSISKAEMTGTYGLHLFFNEKEYVDVVRIIKGPGGQLMGDMDVPNDFRGKLQNIRLGERQLSFDVFVPKNAARPKDMIFSYRLQYFDNNHNQFVGYVTLQGQTAFIASFVGFKRGNLR